MGALGASSAVLRKQIRDKRGVAKEFARVPHQPPSAAVGSKEFWQQSASIVSAVFPSECATSGGMIHMGSNLDHILVTRFNLPSKGHESLVRAREDWLKNRVMLFERYCLPSVAAQTCRRFSWIIYFDPHSPKWLLDWVRNHEQKGYFNPYFREEVLGEDLCSDIRAVVGRQRGAELLTTNLDNDDSLAVDFLARIQGVARVSARTAIYVGDGLIRRGDVLYRHVDPYNAFCSVRESWDAPVTCWTDWHNLLPEQMPAVVLRGNPGWLQVVHGANVSNRVRGRRTHPVRHRAAFPELLDDLPEPPMRQIAKDTLVSVPGRAIRDSGRSTAKAVISKVAGKRGLDRVKIMWTSVRRHPS
jgi:Putative rhamnosyl transferase